MRETTQSNYGMTRCVWIPTTIICNPIIDGACVYAEEKPLVYGIENTQEVNKQRREEEHGFAYKNVNLSDFDFNKYSVSTERMKTLANNYVKYWAEVKGTGNAFYLWSKTPGSGKTFLSCCIGKSIVDTYSEKVRFISEVDYFALLKDKMSAERGTPDKTAVYMECELLIFDDIGKQSPGQWYNSELHRLIDYRNKNNKPTIYTSNFPVEKLCTSDAVKDRIKEKSHSVQMPEESIRVQQAIKNRDVFEQLVLGL